MSFIVRNGKLIAKTKETIKSGESVIFARSKCEEVIDKGRDYCLVNSHPATISNAKKWEYIWEKLEFDERLDATQINEGEFLVN